MEAVGAERSRLEEGGVSKEERGGKEREKAYEISTIPEKVEGKSVLMVSL